MRACFVFTVEGAHRPQIKIINAVQYMVQLGINTVLTEIYTVTCFYKSQLMAKCSPPHLLLLCLPRLNFRPVSYPISRVLVLRQQKELESQRGVKYVFDWQSNVNEEYIQIEGLPFFLQTNAQKNVFGYNLHMLLYPANTRPNVKFCMPVKI